MDNKEKLDEAKAAVEEAAELDLDSLDQVTGGSIGNAKKEKTQDINDSVAQRF